MLQNAQIQAEIIKSTLQVLPELKPEDIQLQNSLRDLGANSMDRAEILMLTMASLKVKVPMLTFAQAKNIGELVSIFEEQLKSASAVI